MRWLVMSVVALAAADVSLKQPQEPFLVAVLQANGSLIPFAAYDGAKWSAPWPEPRSSADARVTTLAGVPREWTMGVTLDRWRLWLPTRTSHTLTARAPAYVDSLCSQNWTLTTDFPVTADRCRNCCAIPTIGVALTSARPFEVPWQLRPSATPISFIVDRINATEDQAVKQSAENRAYHADEAARRARPVTLERAWEFQTVSRDSSLLYVEAVRSYAPPAAAQYRDEACGFTVYQAWIRLDSTVVRRESLRNPRVISEQLGLFDCDMKGSESIVPLGAMVLDGIPHVIVQRNGWESQEHGVLRITNDALRPVLMTPLR